MRAIAEFAMRGRFQAAVAALLAISTVLFFWVGAAVVALATLRQGPREGGTVLAWVLLPTAWLAWKGEQLPLLCLLGATAAALVLRATVSWTWALVAITLVSALEGAALLTVGQPYLEQLVQMFGQVVDQLNQQLATPQQLGKPDALQMAGMMSSLNAIAIATSLALARHWQSLLYNPGGFGEELRALRLPAPLAVALLALAGACLVAGPGAVEWMWLFALPLLVAGLGLVHNLARQRKLGMGWMVALYGGLFFLPPLRELLVLVAALDSWLDLRSRMATRPPEPPPA